MLERESIQDMYIRFNATMNEIYSLGGIILIGIAIRKLLSVLPECWKTKVEAIMEART